MTLSQITLQLSRSPGFFLPELADAKNVLFREMEFKKSKGYILNLNLIKVANLFWTNICVQTNYLSFSLNFFIVYPHIKTNVSNKLCASRFLTIFEQFLSPEPDCWSGKRVSHCDPGASTQYQIHPQFPEFQFCIWWWCLIRN